MQLLLCFCPVIILFVYVQDTMQYWNFCNLCFHCHRAGELNTVDVQAKFVNGKPDRIEARYVMRSSFEWDRFMRFMERYAEENQLGFNKN